MATATALPAVARTLERAGAEGFCVALARRSGRASRRRRAGAHPRDGWLLRRRLRGDRRCAGSSPSSTTCCTSKGLARASRAVWSRPVEAHLKIDTGMARLGVRHERSRVASPPTLGALPGGRASPALMTPSRLRRGRRRGTRATLHRRSGRALRGGDGASSHARGLSAQVSPRREQRRRASRRGPLRRRSSGRRHLRRVAAPAARRVMPELRAGDARSLRRSSTSAPIEAGESVGYGAAFPRDADRRASRRFRWATPTVSRATSRTAARSSCAACARRSSAPSRWTCR